MTTTTAPPAPPGANPVPTTVPVPFDRVAPPMPAPPVGVPVGGNAPVDILLPDGIGADGVIFLRLMIDPSNLSPDAVFSLVEVVK
jgi:hypothetical protein